MSAHQVKVAMMKATFWQSNILLILLLKNVVDLFSRFMSLLWMLL
jgi:hypothetical protein